jgi:arginase
VDVKINVLGVPNSAGAYCVGVERAPAALREAGLLDALAAGGNDVVDAGDLTMRRWAPDRTQPFAQNLPDEVAALLELSGAATKLLAQGERLLVLGGSCTVMLGVCTGMAQRVASPHLIYMDRHLDLNTPLSTIEGSFSWMGVAHALAVKGAVPDLANATRPTPLLTPADVVYLGADLEDATDWERQQVSELGITVVPQASLVDDPQRAARAALDALPDGPFVVHLDVDLLDFIDAPLAENVNGRNSGPTLAQLEPALVEVLRHRDCWALSIGQLEPSHAASDPTAIPRLIGVLREALSAEAS